MTQLAKVPLGKVSSVKELLGNEHARTQIQAVAKNLDAQRVMRSMAAAMISAPALNDCNPMSVLSSVMAAVSMGLTPNTPTQECFVLKYGKNANLVIGYRGMLKILGSTKMVKNVSAHVVYPGDKFDFAYGSHQHLNHTPGVPDPEAEPTHAYAHTHLADGGESFVVMHWAEIEKIRDSSQGYKYALKNKKSNPWIDWRDEMAKKTAIRQLFKHLPLHDEILSNAINADDSVGNPDTALNPDIPAEMRVVGQNESTHEPMAQRAAVPAPKTAAEGPPEEVEEAEVPEEAKAPESEERTTPDPGDLPHPLNLLQLDLNSAEDEEDISAAARNWASYITEAGDETRERAKAAIIATRARLRGEAQ